MKQKNDLLKIPPFRPFRILRVKKLPLHIVFFLDVTILFARVRTVLSVI
jgi:hypothetical protein